MPPEATLVRFGADERSARRRLVCFPYAGGNAATYRAWAAQLPPDVEVVAVQAPGKLPPFREPPLDSIDDLVASALTPVERLGDLPLAVFGHSMGALVAFELTLELERRGGPSPTHLFVSSRRPPDEPSTDSPVHHLADDDFVDAVQRRYQAVPDAVRNEPDLMALLLPILRADIRAYETYTPVTGRRVTCPVHVFGGRGDRHPRPEMLPGWQRVASQPISVQLFDGDHFYLTAHAPALTSAIAAAWAPLGVEADAQ